MKNRINNFLFGMFVGLIIILAIALFGYLMKQAHYKCKANTFSQSEYRECLGI